MFIYFLSYLLKVQQQLAFSEENFLFCKAREENKWKLLIFFLHFLLSNFYKVIKIFYKKGKNARRVSCNSTARKAFKSWSWTMAAKKNPETQNKIHVALFEGQSYASLSSNVYVLHGSWHCYLFIIQTSLMLPHFFLMVLVAFLVCCRT